MVYLNDCVIPGCLAIIGEEVERWGQERRGKKKAEAENRMERWKEGARQGRKGGEGGREGEIRNWCFTNSGGS